MLSTSLKRSNIYFNQLGRRTLMLHREHMCLPCFLRESSVGSLFQRCIFLMTSGLRNGCWRKRVNWGLVMLSRNWGVHMKMGLGAVDMIHHCRCTTTLLLPNKVFTNV